MRRKKSQSSDNNDHEMNISVGPEMQTNNNNNDDDNDQHNKQETNQVKDENQIREKQIVNNSVIIMKMVRQRKRQVIRIKLNQKASIMQLFIVIILFIVTTLNLKVLGANGVLNVTTQAPITLATGITLVEPVDLDEPVDNKSIKEDQEQAKSTSIMSAPTSASSEITTTVSSFSVGDDDDAGNLVLTSEYQVDAATESAMAKGQEPLDVSLLATSDTEETASLAPSTQMSGAESQLQLVRSRKSSPDHRNRTHSDDAIATTTTSTTTTTPSNLSAAQQQLDYDEFDLDYPFKLTGSGSTSSSSEPTLNKRDYDNNQHLAPTPPPWSSLLTASENDTGTGNGHLFKSSLFISNTTSRSLSNETARTTRDQYYHNTPPIMPSLLTVKSAPLTSQELNKVRPHFLFYPDQYSEYNEQPTGSYPTTSGGGGGNDLSLMANGDLYATATNSVEHKQRPPEATYEAPPTRLISNFTINDSTSMGGDNKSAVISLFNGSPVANKTNNSMHSSSPSLALLKTNARLNSRPTTLPPPTSGFDSDSPQVTTIVVDNSLIASPTSTSTTTTTTTTEAPAGLMRGPYYAPREQVISTTATPPTTTTATSRSTGSVAQPPGNNQSSATGPQGQWFNYPHPNLHHNPLLLHHILNKPPSFYAHTLGGAAAHAEQTSPTHAPLSTTTTISSVMPQLMTSGSSTTSTSTTSSPQLISNNNYSPASTSTNIIEGPTYSSSSQQPVNLTLLQMQLDEMHAIAAKAQSLDKAPEPLVGQDNNNNNLVQDLVRSALMRQQAQINNNKLHFISQLTSGGGSKSLDSNWLHQRQHQPKPSYERPTLTSQIITAPSVLQQVYTQRPPARLMPPTQTQTLNSNTNYETLGEPADNLSSSAIASSSDSTSVTTNNGTMSEEDMSTYVALLASLNSMTPPPSLPASQPSDAQMRDKFNDNEDKQQEQELLALLQALQVANQLKTAPSGSSPVVMSQKANAADMLKDTRLIGLSDEVEAQIYRQHLSPQATANSKWSQPGPPLTALKLASTPLYLPPARLPVPISSHKQQAVRPNAESSNALRSFAAMATPPPPTPQRLRPANLQQVNGHLRDIYAMLEGQRDVVPPPYQRQNAFIEAMVKSNLPEQIPDSLANNGTNLKLLSNDNNNNTGSQGDLLTSEMDFDENMSNSSSRPVPEWLESSNQLHEQQPSYNSLAYDQPQVSPAPLPPPPPPPPPPMSAYPHANPFRGISNLFPPSWLSAPAHQLHHSSAASLYPTRLMGAATGRPPARFPLPVYPLRSLFGGPHRPAATAPAGPQPRLLWPVQGPPPPQLTSGPHLMTTAASDLRPIGPLVRLNRPPAFGPQSAAYNQNLQPPTPGKIMLDRFPLASAPAYLVKLPTLTGGTITASGSLVGPQRPFTRGRPPAAFISATPLGALRFLNALAPPRMRLVHPPPPPPPPPSPYAGGLSLQQAPSIVHVHHGAPPPQLLPPPQYAHLHPMPHLHQLHHPHQMHGSQPPSRLQIYVGSSPPSPAITSSASSPSPSSSKSTGGSTSSSAPASSTSTSISGASTGGSDNQQQQQQQQPTALTRLQAATASLVELTSLASLLDEMVGGNDMETSPAIALANALNSLSAAQSAQAATSSTGGANSETAASRLPVGSSGHSGGATSPAASIWRQLFMPNLWRAQSQNNQSNQQVNKLTSSSLQVNNKMRDFSALERLIAHATLGSTGGAQSPRLKVKYIRVPVAVYETGGGVQVTPSLGDQSLQLSTLSAASPHQQTSGKLDPLSIHSTDSPTSTGSGSLTTSSTVQQPPLSSGSSSSSGLGSQSTSSSSTGSGLTASSSNEYLFDETLGSESGPQLNYVNLTPADGSQQQVTNYLPIVRSLPKGLLDPSAAYYSALAQASASQLAVAPPLGDESDGGDHKMRTQKKKKRKKGKRKKGKKLFGSDDDEEEDDNGNNDDDDDDDDNDTLTANDLPVIESLISTIFHGAPTASLLHHQQQVNELPHHHQVNGRHSFRSRTRNLLTPEASSNVLVYAHPNGGGGGLPLVASSSNNHHSSVTKSLLNPFHRQRFSLGEVVGALGAKKLISSLLGRRQRDSRTSKRAAATGSGAVTPSTLLQMATGSMTSSGWPLTWRPTSTTLRPTTTSAAQHTQFAYRKSRNSTSARPHFSRYHHFNYQHHHHHHHSTTPTPPTQLASELQGGFVLDDDQRPLVYPPIAAYESDSFHTRAPSLSSGDRKSLTTTKTTTRRREAPNKLLKVSANNRTLELTNQTSKITSISTASTTTTILPPISRLHKSRHKTNSRGPEDLTSTTTQATSRSLAKGQLEQVVRHKDKMAMPLYHVVADHYNKQNFSPKQDLMRGRQRRRQPPTQKVELRRRRLARIGSEFYDK